MIGSKRLSVYQLTLGFFLDSEPVKNHHTHNSVYLFFALFHKDQHLRSTENISHQNHRALEIVLWKEKGLLHLPSLPAFYHERDLVS